MTINAKGQFVSPDPVEYFNANYSVDERTGCWNWTGAIFSTGYGAFRNKIMNKKRGAIFASRASWRLHRGEPGKLFVCHKCDNKLCVNPDHLFLGTCKDNMQDCKSKGRMNKGEDRPQSKLTEDDVRRIRLQKAQGQTYRSLAKEFNISTGTLVPIIKRRGWSHVT